MPTLVTDEDHLHALRHRRGVKVKALSKKGRHAEAEEALNRMTDLADRGVRGDAQGFWTPSELYFSPSWVYAAMGRGDATARAREELLRRTPGYVYATNIRLRIRDEHSTARGLGRHRQRRRGARGEPGRHDHGRRPGSIPPGSILA